MGYRGTEAGISILQFSKKERPRVVPFPVIDASIG
jgi:hypothetical protein